MYAINSVRGSYLRPNNTALPVQNNREQWLEVARLIKDFEALKISFHFEHISSHVSISQWYNLYSKEDCLFNHLDLSSNQILILNAWRGHLFHLPNEFEDFENYLFSIVKRNLTKIDEFSVLILKRYQKKEKYLRHIPEFIFSEMIIGDFEAEKILTFEKYYPPKMSENIIEMAFKTMINGNKKVDEIANKYRNWEY